jgi:hypothetical protein
VLAACYYKAIYDATIAFCDLAQKEIGGWERTNGLGATERTRDLLSQLLADEQLPVNDPHGQQVQGSRSGEDTGSPGPGSSAASRA